MTENLLSLFQERGAILEGHFLLSSGLHSPRYLQCALVLMDPPLATRLGQDLANELKPVIGGWVDAVVGPALGGILVAYEVARALGCRSLFTERAGSVMTLRRGFRLEPGEKVVVVEDAITTGRSTREVLDVVKAERAEVVGVGSLVDRSASPPNFGVPLRSLLRLDVPTYAPETCPLCAQGSHPTKPGSRPTPAA
jgi:orotate phosphoribosyltransferase